MSDAASSGEHVSDEEIDRYSAGLLPEDRVRPFEEHYLECRDCLLRVDRVEALVTGLRALPERRSWRNPFVLGTAAAGLAGLALGWQLHVLRGPVEVNEPPPARVRASASGQIGAGASWARFDLEPALRDVARIQTIQLPAGATQILLSIDSGEAGPPGSVFDVSLIDGEGRPLIVLRGIPSAADGLVSVAIPAVLLKPGEYVVQARHQSALLEIPFQVELPSAKP